MLRSLAFLAIALGQSFGALAQVTPNNKASSVTYAVVARPLTPAVAPADEYFGRFKLSNLGVRNMIHDMTVEGDSPLALPMQVGRIKAVESALADWSSKYPRDPWLPSAMVRFATFLISKQQPEYDRAAISFLYFLSDEYPGTWYAKYAQRQLRVYDELPNFDVLAAPGVGEYASVIEYDLPAIDANRRHH